MWIVTNLRLRLDVLHVPLGSHSASAAYRTTDADNPGHGGSTKWLNESMTLLDETVLESVGNVHAVGR